MIRFVDVLGRTLPKPRLRDVCQHAELTGLESQLLLSRCCDGLSADQIADLRNITPRQQRVFIPVINNKIELWACANATFFSARELDMLNNNLSRYRLPLIGH